MYGIILATALTTGTTAPDHFYKRSWCSCACYACSCGCYCGGCYCGGCYGCWSYCSCSGCYGGYGRWGAYSCASYYGCWTTCGCYGCYGSCGGWGWGCSCSCYSCYGCYGCYGCHGAVIYGGTVPPVYGTPAPAEKLPAPGKVNEKKEEASLYTPATVVVKADLAATIKVNGQVTPRRAAVESYRSPALEPGRTYSYTVVAELNRDGKALTETKEITVAAGRETVVDFTNLGAVAAAETEPASVTVVLPEGAKLTVNDVVVNVNGNQTFQTPKLEKGKSYFYTVKAELTRDGRSVTETRRIDVAAGKAVTVDFTQSSTLTASR
jgi:uncharacterized protein (TIGR03000 family)